MAKEIMQPMQFELTVGEHDYTIEFTRASVKEADALGVIGSDKMGLMDKMANILYVGLKKHHPFTTAKLAKKILEEALEEDGYEFDDFSAITDDFNRCVSQVFTSSQSKGKKIVGTPVTMTK